MKQDRLSVKWVHTYYIQHRDLWSIPNTNGLTWSLRKIWHHKDILLQSSGVSQFVFASKFNIHRMYKYLHQSDENVDLRRLVYNSKASPKSTFYYMVVV